MQDLNITPSKSKSEEPDLLHPLYERISVSAFA